MNNTKIDTSLDDTKELKELIISNPDLPLLIFCGDECYSGEYCYESAHAHGIDIKELTIYQDMYVEKDDYKDRLSDSLGGMAEFEKLSDAEFEKMIDGIVDATEFIKAIVVYVG